MGGGDLNLKKSWHPSTRKNMEQVWKAEQQDNLEKRRIAELQREIAMEKDREHMQSYVKKEKDDKKLEWMYKPQNKVDREQYLLGRSIDTQFEQMVREEKEAVTSQPKNHVEHECIPPSLRDLSGKQEFDVVRKLQEDPLYAIKKKEQETRKELLNNPVRLKQLKEMLRERVKQEEDGAKKKRKSSDADRELDELLAAKYKKLRGVLDEENLIKSIKKLKKKNKKKKKKTEDSADDSSSDESSRKKHRKDRSKDRRKEEKYGSKKMKKRRESSDDDSSTDESSRKKHRKDQSKDRRKDEKTSSRKMKKRKESSDDDSSTDESSRKKNRKDRSKDRRKEEKYGRNKMKRRDSSEDDSRDDSSKNKAHVDRSREEKHERRGKERFNTEETVENALRRNYGLMRADGSKMSPSKGTSSSYCEVKTEVKASKTEQKWVPPKRVRLTEEEKEKRRQEMMADALQRDKERKKNVDAFEEQERKEASKKLTFSEDFAQKQFAMAANRETVSSRIRSNLNNIQRTSSMDKNFARR